jgi:hypothetical protein
MKPIEIPALDPEQLAALDDLYRSTRNVRLRTEHQSEGSVVARYSPVKTVLLSVIGRVGHTRELERLSALIAGSA